MDTKSVVDAPARDIPEMIAARAERGRQLYLMGRQLISKTGEDTYLVPSAATEERYRVRYGAEVEECDCRDFQINGEEVSCKHLVCVALMHATERALPSLCVSRWLGLLDRASSH